MHILIHARSYWNYRERLFFILLNLLQKLCLFPPFCHICYPLASQACHTVGICTNYGYTRMKRSLIFHSSSWYIALNHRRSVNDYFVLYSIYIIRVMSHEHDRITNYKKLNCLFNELFGLTANKTLHYWPSLWGETTCSRWILLTKGKL